MPTVGLILALSLLTAASVCAQTRLALHATREEVEIWRQRGTTGPYADEWANILSNAKAWLVNPDARWKGNTSNRCWVGASSDPGRKLDSGMVDAAFVYLLTGDTSYRDVVRRQLLAQTTVAGTNFSNGERWCADGTNHGLGDDIGPWVRKLVYAYSYIRPSLSAGDIKTIDAWFLGVGNHFAATAQSLLVKRFPGRLNGDYATCGSVCPGNNRGRTHFGGPMVTSFTEAWNNITSSQNAVIAAVGILLDNAMLKDRAKRGFHEWIKYGSFPGGQVVDQFRWNPGVSATTSETVTHAYHYSSETIGSQITVADHFARAGDPSLYTYTTSAGRFGTEGGPKSLLKILQHFAGLTNGAVVEYASTTATTAADKRIDAVDDATNQNHVGFVYLAPANLFYNDAAVKKAYTRAIPSTYTSAGCEMLRGEWCTYPSVRFMFGQMEGKVWPYPTGVPPVAPPPIEGHPLAPMQLRLTGLK